ncbi:MAG: bacterial Ig-like domain-containing protein [Clostridiales bacterium]|nr:bacterial Ig-like domain-containing protein [Clostridiales bacterium]
MKKSSRLVFVLLLVLATTLGVFGFVACGGRSIESLTVKNAKIDFIVGDEFELGESFSVVAKYSDGTDADVTKDVSVRQESGFDMSVAGEYQITISYDGKKVVYSIYVSGFDNTLKKIELDTTAAKLNYQLGDELSYDGLVVKTTYENAQGRLIESTAASIKDFSVVITDKNGNTTDESFSGLGEYTVTISKDSVSASYNVAVDGINISGVQGALNVGRVFNSEVVSGTQNLYGALHGGELYDDYEYTYKFGNNYTYVMQKGGGETYEYHYSMDGGDLFCVTHKTGKIVPNGAVNADMINGAPIDLWYHFKTEYGIEHALISLYKSARECTNKDLVETADESTRRYSFKFSGLMLRSSISDYYETTVSFTLGEKYNIATAEIVQDYYENNSDYAGAADYSPSFVTDSNGITVPNKAFSSRLKVVIAQTAGERKESNPYSADMFKFKSFDLVYKGKVIEDGGEIACDMSDKRISVTIANILPETADFSQDVMFFNDGAYSGDVNSAIMLNAEGYLAYRNSNNSNVISITLRNGGVWKLIIKTENVTKTITLNVTGVAPDSMDAQIRNDSTGVFYHGESKTVALNGTVNFCGSVNKYANAEQTAEIVSSNKDSAKIEKVTKDGQTYYAFSATQEGVYKVRITSVANPELSCSFTVTVMDMPDYAAILIGKYSVQSLEGNIYELEFSPENDGEQIKGSVKVTKTPTFDDNTPDTDNATTQVISYEVNFEYLEIDLNPVSGANMGILLSVNADGELVLTDQYDNEYILKAENE